MSPEEKKASPFRNLPFGTAGGIRTPDLLVRSQTLYPAELQPLVAVVSWRLVYTSTAEMKLQVFFSIFLKYF